jgi:hypothetical protein
METSPQSRISQDRAMPEAAGPLTELADGIWLPAEPGPPMAVPPLLSPAERDYASSPEAIAAGARDLAARMDAAAERERARIW